MAKFEKFVKDLKNYGLLEEYVSDILDWEDAGNQLEKDVIENKMKICEKEILLRMNKS